MHVDADPDGRVGTCEADRAGDEVVQARHTKPSELGRHRGCEHPRAAEILDACERKRAVRVV